MVLNGEIYNYRELRADLVARGHRFKTASDTEVLVHLYEQEGTAGIQRLRGMFAFAIWDARAGSLLLARDRFGKKPLYYAVLPGGLYFGSELKCLRAAGVPLEPDREALQLYLLLNYIPEPWSAYRAIRKLAPGTWLRYHASGHTEQGRYWQLPVPAEEPAPGFTEDAACRQVRDALRRSGANATDRRRAAGRVLERWNRFRLGSGVHGVADAMGPSRPSRSASKNPASTNCRWQRHGRGNTRPIITS